tara:strand:+ start:1307 stop:2500 length:1194 start_codon:yes stop_codon:yes gene_type:complete
MATHKKATYLPLDKPLLCQNAVVVHLEDILKDFDPETFEHATTKFRKPSYQRALDKPLHWNQELVGSILNNMAIGAIVVSKWTETITDPDGTTHPEDYYNVEDGGTRLGALSKFYGGKFKTKYGGIEEDAVKERFSKYKVSVVEISKTNGRVKDSKYFAKLCANFSHLQDGTALTPSDRYCSVRANTSHGFEGSPMVNFTLDNAKHADFENYFGISDIGPDHDAKNHNKLASAISLTSGLYLGPKYANDSFYAHLPILFNPINGELQTRYRHSFKLICNTIDKCELEKPKEKGERFKGLFSKTKLFTGPMIADIYEAFPEDTVILANEHWRTFSIEFTTRWCKLINAYREKVSEGDKRCADDWLDDVVYSGLRKGQKRNAGKNDLICRMKKIKVWTS